MARKDVPDTMVVQAAIDRWQIPGWPFLYDVLMERSGQPYKVVYRAMERSASKGYIEYGTSLRTAWATDKGKLLLEKNTTWLIPVVQFGQLEQAPCPKTTSQR